jgi:hypothetical protein
MAHNKFIFAVIFCIASFSASADVLLIDVIDKEPANNASGLLRPTNGQSMEQVKSKYGEPAKIYPTIGEPPITRWNFEKFAVYFEYNLVIHSVVNKPKKAP